MLITQILDCSVANCMSCRLNTELNKDPTCLICEDGYYENNGVCSGNIVIKKFIYKISYMYK